MKIVSVVAMIARCVAASGCAHDNLRKRGQHRATRAGTRVGAQSEPAQRAIGIAYFKANRLAGARDSARSEPCRWTDGRRRGAVSRPHRRSAERSCRRRETAYESYLKVGKNARREEPDRANASTVMARKEHEAEAKRAIAQEQQLSVGRRFAAHCRRDAVRVHRQRHVAQAARARLRRARGD